MAKVYRYEIESEQHNHPGPYVIIRYHSELIKNYPKYMKLVKKMCVKHNDNLHPSIRVDVIEFTDNDFCCCESINSLMDWFKGFNSALVRLGFKLVEYEVSTLKTGLSGLQSSFQKENIIKRKILV